LVWFEPTGGQSQRVCCAGKLFGGVRFPLDTDGTSALSPPPNKKEGGYNLGIDIGDSGVKLAVYQYHSEEKTIEDEPEAAWSIDTERREANTGKQGKYKDINDFIKYIDMVSENSRGKQKWKQCKENLVAMGIAWPGPVTGELGRESVSSFSQVLSNFKPYCKPDKYTLRCKDDGGATPFFKASAKRLQQLEVREAFGRYFFKKDGEDAPVVLLNDGACHVIDALSRAKNGTDNVGPNEMVVILAAGTGTAMGAIQTSSDQPLDVLAEAGKVMTNIGCKLDKNWLTGTGGYDFCTETLSTVAKDVFEEMTCDPCTKEIHIPPLLIGYLLAAVEENEKEKTKIKKDWKTKEAHGKKFDACYQALEEALQKVKVKPSAFAKEVANRVGIKLADLTALSWELFHATTLYVSGQLMSGSIGKHV